ncbi:MAG: hypothetical protein E6H43_04095 [Betaproteobacteria bacterium]|nr:MAG: hypothetical protein E6H43_04095 [Betaproteobacteria bacterium]
MGGWFSRCFLMNRSLNFGFSIELAEHFTRYFRPKCGTHVFGRDDRPPSPKVGFRLVSVAIGTLDDPELVPPRVHQWWSNHVSWYQIQDELPQFQDGRLTHPSTRQSHEP